MTNSNITIDTPGMLTLVVDAGRDLHQQEQGFCVSGAIDIRTYHLVNWLCGNRRHTSTFEVIGKLGFSVDNTVSIAVGGPDVKVSVNGEPAEPWRTLTLERDDQIEVETQRLGSKSYVAIAGNWRLPFVGGSQSIVRRESIGGLNNDGQAVQQGDRFEIEVNTTQVERQVTTSYIPDYSLSTPLDVVTGYQYPAFDEWRRQLFFSSEYQVSDQIDRMGYRLNGQAIECQMRTMRSEGINFGAIQIPPDGQPIVMMSDRQTLGGYPKIGCVAEYDIYRLAQAVPCDVVTFRPVDNDNARANWLLRNRLEQQLFECFESEDT